MTKVLAAHRIPDRHPLVAVLQRSEVLFSDFTPQVAIPYAPTQGGIRVSISIRLVDYWRVGYQRPAHRPPNDSVRGVTGIKNGGRHHQELDCREFLKAR